MSDGRPVRVRVIGWGWRGFLRHPWPLVRFRPRMVWLPECRSLMLGPYEFIWKST